MDYSTLHANPSFSFSSFSKREQQSMGIIGVIAVLLCIFSFIRFNISAAILACVGILAFIPFAAYLYWLYTRNLSHNKPRLLVSVVGGSVILAIALEALTLVGSPSSSPLILASWSMRRLSVFAIVSFCVLSFWILHYQPFSTTHQTRQHVNALTTENLSPRFSLRYLLDSTSFLTIIILVVGCALAFATGITSWNTNQFFQRLVYFLLIICLAIGLIAASFKFGIAKTPRIFLILALCFGTFMSFSLPPVTGNSWDDQIHYSRSVTLSYLGYNDYFESDYILSTSPQEMTSDPDASIVRLNEAMSASRESQTAHEIPANFTPDGSSILAITTIGYVPSAIGLWIARLLHLNPSGMVILGRWANLIAYALVMYNAIRLLPTKKALLAFLGLLPTSLFLACSYSYDPWVISWIALGIALTLREVYSSDVKLSPTSLGCIVYAFLLGLCPKAIYFPVIGLLFMLPASKFNSTKQHKLFIGFAVVFGLFVVATFILPLLFSPSAQAGDYRGGSDVSAVGQIRYILQNPLTYTQTLFNFLLQYLSTGEVFKYTMSTAYLSYLDITNPLIAYLASLPPIMFVVISVLDVSPQDIKPLGFGRRIWIAIIFFGTIILVATSLYISFTPVGLNTINGCQGRYLLPMLPLLLGLPEVKIVRTNNYANFSLYCMGAAAFLLVFCCFTSIVHTIL